MKSNYLRRIRALEARLLLASPPEPIHLVFNIGPVDPKRKLSRRERIVIDYCVCGNTWSCRKRITDDRNDEGYACGSAEDLLQLGRTSQKMRKLDNSLGCWQQAYYRDRERIPVGGDPETFYPS